MSQSWENRGAKETKTTRNHPELTVIPSNFELYAFLHYTRLTIIQGKVLLKSLKWVCLYACQLTLGG